MEGSGRKRRVYLIDGKRLVEGDPNVVTDNEIILKPVVVEGKTTYKLVDSEGNTISTGDSDSTPSVDRWLYVASDAFNYANTYTGVCENIEEFAELAKELCNCVYSDGIYVSHNCETLVLTPWGPIEELRENEIDPYLSSTERIDLIKNYIHSTHIDIPENYGPFLCIGGNSDSYLNSTSFYISIKPYISLLAVYDREKDVWIDLSS